MKNKILIANILLAIIICVVDILYITIGGLPLKATASALFVLLGLINLCYAVKNKQNKVFSIILFIGLFFAMLGDIVLNIHFISGAILFAVAHVFYFCAYSTLVKIRLRDFGFGLIIFIPSILLITLAPMFDFGGVLMEVVCCVYALIISMMVGKSISNLTSKKSLITLIIVIGSVLFFISDFMLLLNVFGNVGRFADILCLATYYPAEILLAYSLTCFKK